MYVKKFGRLCMSFLLGLIVFAAGFPVVSCVVHGYNADIELSEIGVCWIQTKVDIHAILDAGNTVRYPHQSAVGDNMASSDGMGDLVLYDGDGQMIPSNSLIRPGVLYRVNASVENIGMIDSYNRVCIYRYWVDNNGIRDTTMDPGTIGYEIGTDGLIVDPKASTNERNIVYSDSVLRTGESRWFVTDFRIDPAVLRPVVSVSTQADTSGSRTVMLTKTDRGTVGATLELKADAVQEHNAVDAIWTAWGVRVEITNDGRIELVNS